MEQSLLYISRKQGDPAEGCHALDAIVDISVPRNRSLCVTGVLVSAGPCFAQLLEGDAKAIDVLMASIRRDPRHRDLRVLSQGPIDHRHCRTWMLGYAGEASYFVDRIAPMVDQPAPAPECVRSLVRLMRQMQA